jgi:predicted permease
VSANYFEVLGVQAAVGRPFHPDEDAAPGDIVVLGDQLARRQFGTAASAVGQALRLNGRAFEVIGVAPPGFTGFDPTTPADLFLPTRAAARLGLALPPLEDRTSRGIGLVARLASGVTLAAARAQAEVAAGRLHAAYPVAWTDVRGAARRLSVLPEREIRVPPGARGRIVSFAGVLMASVGLVLLICCANVAGLLLARMTGRAREIGIRIALGAGTSRLVPQVVGESLLLAAAGGALGTLGAMWMMHVVSRTVGQSRLLGVSFQASLDLRVLAFTAAVTLATAVLFGLAPALGLGATDVMAVLRREGGGLRSGRGGARSLLVAGQLALSLPLLTGALLLANTLRIAYRIDPGFAIDHSLVVPIAPLPGTAPGDPGVVALALRDRIAAIPGVTAVSWGSARPLAGVGSRRGMDVEGYEPHPGEDMEFHVNHVGPGYFEAIGIPIVRGRSIGEADRAGAPEVVVVNQAFVRRFWPDGNALGRHIRMPRGGARAFLVVGIARDVRFLSLTDEPRPYVWVASLQFPRPTLFQLRTAGGPGAVLPAIESAVHESAPGWTVGAAETMRQGVAGALFEARLAGGTIGCFALLALALAAIGLYGIIAYSVTQRTREVGLRVALGARPAAVMALFLRQAAPLVAIGITVGLAAAYGATRALAGLLIGVGARDRLTFVLAALVLAGSALVATLIPARRAARVDPMEALRHE